jgi:hypothetical protein
VSFPAASHADINALNTSDVAKVWLRSFHARHPVGGVFPDVGSGGKRLYHPARSRFRHQPTSLMGLPSLAHLARANGLDSRPGEPTAVSS